MIVFHGSDHIVEHPVLNGGKRSNDYGSGFYTTESLELAKEWACAKNTDGFANRYELDLTGLSILNLNAPEYNILNWLALLTRCRSCWQTGSIAEEAKNYLQEHFFVDPTPYDIIIGYRADDSYFSFAQDFVAGAPYDIIIGYRADDSYFSFAQDFVAGTISLKKLSEAMRLGRLGEQIILKSQKAYNQIRFLDAEPADAKIYYERKAMRDREARREYRKTKGAADSLSELYMLDIMREGITNGDPRLR